MPSAVRLREDYSAEELRRLSSLICPSLNSITSRRPCPSQMACSLEFRPSLVRPIRREQALF